MTNPSASGLQLMNPFCLAAARAARLALSLIRKVASHLIPTRRPGLPGDKPYTPTRLEWFAAELNAAHSKRFDERSPYQLNFTSRSGQDTIQICITHLPAETTEALGMIAATARECVRMLAMRHGWGWIRISVKLSSLNAPALVFSPQSPISSAN